MSAAAKDVELLKQQAEAQMRRAAPALPGKSPKRRKVDQDDQDEGTEVEDTVGRFSYAADAAIAAGSTCLLASCGFNRQRSAAKELLGVVKGFLPEGTQIEMVKVGCRGLAVVRLTPAAAAAAAADSSPVPVTEIVGQVLEHIQAGKLPHTKFCERIVPAETTCLLTSAALEAALTRVVSSYLAQLQQQSNTSGDCAAHAAGTKQPVEFAVLYKSRGVDKQILAEMEKEAAKQQLPSPQPASADSGIEQQQQQEAAADKADTETASAGAEATQQGLDRQRIVDIAAAVMEKCCKDTSGAKVNLSKPQVVILVEVLPLQKQQMACALAMLPRSIMSSSHKLKIKATSGDGPSKGTAGDQKQRGHNRSSGQP